MTTEHDVRSLFDPKYQELLEFKKQLRGYQKYYLLSGKGIVMLFYMVLINSITSYVIFNTWYYGVFVSIVLHVFLIPEIVHRSLIKDKIKELYK